MAKKEKKKIRVRLKGYDQRKLDDAVIDIVKASQSTEVRVAGPIPLPTKREKTTTLRSPHGDRKSHEQFETRTFNRVLEILDPTPHTLDTLKGLSIVKDGIEIKVKPITFYR